MSRDETIQELERLLNAERERAEVAYREGWRRGMHDAALIVLDQPYETNNDMRIMAAIEKGPQ